MRGALLPLVAALFFNMSDPDLPRSMWSTVADTVAIQTFQFKPVTLEVRVGTKVTWTNGDQIEHTVTAGIPDSTAGGFSGSLAMKGSTWSRTFDRPGVYPYYCDRHHFMRGEIHATTTGGN